MKTATPVEMALALMAVGLAAYLGYFFNQGLGALSLAGLTAIASGSCLFAAMKWGWGGLLATMLLIGIVGAKLGYKLSKRRGALCVAFLWFWFCALFLLIYGHDDWITLFTIALPSFFLLWGGLFALSGYILPPQEGLSDWRRKAFRTLLTFALGTNYPYYIIEDWKKEPPRPQVEGDNSRQFLAGPGIVITSCDHLVTLSDGLKFKGVKAPGLTFTGLFDRIQAVVDLRPQLRAFTVKAETKDGIPLEVLTFVPFRTDAGQEQPRLGQSYPFDEEAIFRAVHEQPIEHKWWREDGQAIEEQDQIPWDELVPMIAPPLLRDVIVEYTCDGLCGPGDPRTEIKQRFKERVTQAMKSCGIQIIGGGISNLKPADESIIQQRIENWRADWKRKIEIEIGEGEAEVARQLESVRTQAQIKVMRKVAAALAVDKALSERALALHLIEAIEEIAQEKPVRQRLPEETQRMSIILQRLRHNLGNQGSQ